MASSLRRTLALAALLPALLAADSTRSFMAPEKIHRAIESAWTGLRTHNATLTILEVPSLLCTRTDAAVEVVLSKEHIHPGPRAIAVSCREGARTISRGLANVLVQVRQPVWFSRQPLERGEILEVSSLIREERTFEREPHAMTFDDPEKRWLILRDIASGSPIAPSDVKQLPDVEAGSSVALVSRVGRARVTVTARVRRSGDVGETILVQNPVSGRIVPAVLIDRETAILQSPGSELAERGGKP